MEKVQGKGGTVHTWRVQQSIFGKKEDSWSIILVDNPDGHHFVLTEILKLFLLKMHATDKIFDKVCLKTITDTIFPNMWSVIRKRMEESIFW